MFNTTRNLMGSGNAALSAQQMVGQPLVGLTAAGNAQTNAPLLYADINEFTTVAAGAGAILNFNNIPGDTTLVVNSGTNALLVYPEINAANPQQINALGANNPFSVPVNGKALFFKATLNRYYVFLSA